MESAKSSSTKLQGSETPSVNHTSMPSHRGCGSFSQSSSGTSRDKGKACYLCGGKHSPTTCKFAEVVCNNCHKKGHVARACLGGRQVQVGGKAQGLRQQNRQRPQHQTNAIHGTDPGTDSEEYDSSPLLRVGRKARQPIVVQLTVEGKEIPMEIDTGAAVSLISLVTKEQLFPQNELLDTTLVLTTYTGEQMAVVGQMKNYGETSELLYLYVVEGQGPSLMEREWLNEITIDWQKLNMATDASNNVARVAKKI